MPQPRIPSTLKAKEIDTGEGRTQNSVPTELWLDKVKSTINSPDKMWQVSEKVCIYRVPKPIIISKPEAYVPVVVSLGPYHHNINCELSNMDRHKLEAVRRIFTKLKKDVNTLIVEIVKLESEIKKCYEEPIDLGGEALSWMLVMDACFILEFFRSFSVRREDIDYSYYFSLIFQTAEASNSTYFAILNDIIKLENQIPLFILKKIIQLECGTDDDATKKEDDATTKLAEILSNNIVFRGYPFLFSWYDDAKTKLKEHMMKERRAKHLLDLYRMVVNDLLTKSSAGSANPVVPSWMQILTCIDILPCLSPRASPDDSRATPSAELLHRAGVRFQPCQLRFEKRRFGRSMLSLPRITIDDSTEIMLRNLRVYEECQRCSWSPDVTVISHFVRLLDDLIDSEKDVSLLRKSGVIQSFLGSNEDIARMFNRLGEGITFSGIEQIEEVMKQVRDHYKSKWKVWISQLKEEHFSKPWKFLSVVAAIALLGMTAVQTANSGK